MILNYPTLPSPPEMSEDRLAAYLRYRAALLDDASRIVGRAHAEDVVQDAWLRFDQPATAVRQPGGYLFRIVRNLALDRLRRSRWEAQGPEAHAAVDAAVSSLPDPEQHASARDELQRLQAALDALPADQRRAFELHRMEDAGYRSIASQLGVSQGKAHALVQAAQQQLQAAVAPTAARLRRGRLAAGISACLAVVALALAGPGLLSQWRGDVRTGTAERQQIVLDDGSTISLDARSVLAAPAHQPPRQAQLLTGRAYFDIAPDRQHPFHVQADGVDIRVLGTGFSVEKHDGAVEVALEHGAVQVQRGDAQLRLQPGQRVRVSADGPLRAEPIATAAIGAWRYDQLVLEDAPLSEMVAALQPYQRGRIVLRSEALAQQRVTGVFDLRNPEAALQTAVQPFGGQVRPLGPWLVLVED